MALTPNAGTVKMNKASFTPIRIMLDTSALRRDPRLKGGGFEALARLAEAGYVQIYIPDIVAREFGSAALNVADTFAETRNALAKLRRFVPEDAQARVSAFESDLVLLCQTGRTPGRLCHAPSRVLISSTWSSRVAAWRHRG